MRHFCWHSHLTARRIESDLSAAATTPLYGARDRVLTYRTAPKSRATMETPPAAGCPRGGHWARGGSWMMATGILSTRYFSCMLYCMLKWRRPLVYPFSREARAAEGIFECGGGGGGKDIGEGPRVGWIPLTAEDP